ncbi:hypothetical protein ILYODFUR_005148 [Ilyodon furcidens]|uniref:Secreted protein n=1 Tax=Ilyodon furcidens TaxID=33524 RepID=A0ABV0V1I5_9TELE
MLCLLRCLVPCMPLNKDVSEHLTTKLAIFLPVRVRMCVSGARSEYRHAFASFFLFFIWKIIPCPSFTFPHICPHTCLICNLISGKGKPVDYPAFIRGEKPSPCQRKKKSI